MTLPQWIAGVGVTLLLVHLGLLGGWASPTLPRLTAPDSPIPITLKEASWIASLVNFGRFFGGITGAAAAAYFGSKRAIFITILPIAVGWLLIMFADSATWLYVSRLSSGLGLGMAFTTFPLYIGEVSMSEIRGALISLATVGAPFGQVVASICGSYVSVSGAATAYLALAVVLLGLFFWLPESPHHLVKVGKFEAAKKSIIWYRAGKEVEMELNAVENFVTSGHTASISAKLREFSKPAIRKASIQTIALFVFMQSSGLNIVMFFMEQILTRAKFTAVNPSLVVICVNVSCILASIVSIFLIDKCGRKFLLFISSVGATIAMLGLMSHFLFINNGMDVAKLQWLPIASIFVFMISYFVGLMPVPNAILSEILPANVKFLVACIANLVGAMVSFISAKTYQPLIDLVGDAYVFMIYAILSFLIMPYTIFFMYETKGKTLQEIQDGLMK